MLVLMFFKKIFKVSMHPPWNLIIRYSPSPDPQRGSCALGYFQPVLDASR
jgi:hypothetical protein